MQIITKLLLTVLTLLVIARFVPGIEVEGFYIALIVAVILGFINLIIKPIIVILTIPINILTLGFFTFVINALLFWFVATFVEGFAVHGFIPAFTGAFILAVVGWFSNRVLD